MHCPFHKYIPSLKLKFQFFRMSFFKSNFQRVLEKCTSNLLLEPDWDGMLQLCDLIRGNDVKAREAVASIKKTLEVQNPHQQYFGYCVLDTVVKNCGAPVHQEVIKRAFLEQLKEKCQLDQGSQVRLSTKKSIFAFLSILRG